MLVCHFCTLLCVLKFVCDLIFLWYVLVVGVMGCLCWGVFLFLDMLYI